MGGTRGGCGLVCRPPPTPPRGHPSPSAPPWGPRGQVTTGVPEPPSCGAGGTRVTPPQGLAVTLTRLAKPGGAVGWGVKPRFPPPPPPPPPPSSRSPKVPTPWHVTTSWGCHRPLKLLLKKGGDAEPRDQVSGDGESPFGGAACAGTLIIGCPPGPGGAVSPRGGPGRGGSSVPLPAGRERSHGPGAGANPVGLAARPGLAPHGGWSLSFLTEDGTDDSVTSELPEDGPLSSTRRSLLEELGGGSGEPLSLAIPSLTPWPPGGSALPPQPLASSTLLWDGRVHRGPPRPLSDETLRRRLRALGDNPGPVTELTRWLYLRRLEELVRGPRGSPAGESWGLPPTQPVPEVLMVVPNADMATPGHSPELVAALRTGHVPDCAQDELVLAQQFDRPDRTRHWREGLVKSSFNYLLLDPRTTQNLPLRSHRLSPAECFRTFVEAIFYVGKGTRARPYCHLAEALSQHRAGTQKGCPKVRRILEIWGSGHGVISVHCFQSTVPAEAYTREGCLVEALGLQTITNQRKGNCYGVAASWPAERRRRLGVHMLHRAMRIFLAEGERQLRPPDIQGGR
uniref:Ankyrin repeat and LEM domain containing 1 n=1 Tax=Calidris pygmaea TaxID=425635 RepID=A0A8C3JRX7_9CHAR